MNNEVVYVKTEEGEAAMHQRTRLVQRNLRMVLIQIDGHSSVAELKKRMVDQSIVEPSLEELVRMNLIEPLENRIDREAPVLEVAPIPSQVSAGWEDDLDSILPPDALENPKLGAETVDDEPDLPALEKSGTMETVAALPASGGVKSLWAKVRQAREERAFEKAYRDESAEKEIRLKPVRRGSRRSVLTWALGGLIVLALALVSVVLAYPYGRHLPQMERMLESALGEPVKIASMGFAMAPYPHVNLNQVSVGGSEATTAELVRISPSFGSLLLFSLVPNKVEIVGVRLKAASLGRTARWFGRAGVTGVTLRNVSFSGLDLDVGGVSLGSYHGDMIFTPEGRMARVVLKNETDNLVIEAEPKGAVFSAALTGRNWQLPFKRGIDVEYFDAKGEIGSEGMKLTRLEAKVFDGLVAATADLSWGGEVSISGRGEMRSLSLSRVAAAISPAFSASGAVNGVLRVDTGSGRLNQLAHSAVIRGEFEVSRGNVNRFDIVEALRSTGRIPSRGGKTPFEQLTGVIEIAGGEGRISGLQLVSGLLKATGEVRMDAGETLSGRIEADLKGTAGQKAPLAVTGTLADPQLNLLRGGR